MHMLYIMCPMCTHITNMCGMCIMYKPIYKTYHKEIHNGGALPYIIYITYIVRYMYIRSSVYTSYTLYTFYIITRCYSKLLDALVFPTTRNPIDVH